MPGNVTVVLQRRRIGLFRLLLGIVLAVSFLLTGCAASRSPLSGTFNQPAVKNSGTERVSVFFLFRHMEQQHGYDAIPKLKGFAVKDFDNLFRDALGEISNISRYDSFTELPNDVNTPERRQKRENAEAACDYSLVLTVFEESSFRQQMLSGTISLLSLTLIPMPYSWDYTVTAELRDQSGRLLRTYQRKATLTNWMEAVLMFVYPFHPLEGKREEIYAESLHDIFRQIETEKALKKPAGVPRPAQGT